MRDILRITLLAAAFALGTWIIGWWAVPVLAAVWGVLARNDMLPGVAAAIAAALGWAVLLLTDALVGNLGMLLSRLGPLFKVPGILLPLIAMLFAALLAWAAAATTASVLGDKRSAA